MSKFKKFLDSPFLFVDSLQLGRLEFFNPFSKFRLTRKIAFCVAILAGVAWVLFGFDSCIGQPLMLLYNIPSLIFGQISSAEFWQIWVDHYGKEMHYSAFVIYGLMYWFLSRHFDKNLGITGSRNVCFSAALTLFSIGVFEFYWIFCYGIFQNQSWVFTPMFPQLKILLQNFCFVFVGLIGGLVIWQHSYLLDKTKTRIVRRLYRFNFDNVALVLFFVTFTLALLWIFYPLPVHRFSVMLETGEVWSNTGLFPQTLYTVDLNPSDGVNSGVWYWFENDAVHGLNTIVKAMFSLTVLYIGAVRKVG